MKIRQIALVTAELATVRDALFELLGLDDAYIDEGVAHFGLENAVMTIGTTFLELVSPVQDNTTAGRLLERRGGDGGYMVIVQVDDLAAEVARLEPTGIRTVWEADIGTAKAIHLHPKDVPGAIASMDEMDPVESWHWAGPDWETRAARHVSAITGAQIQSADPSATAQQWALAYGQDIVVHDGIPSLQLDDSEIRFVADTNGRGDGLQAIDLRITDSAAVLTAAHRLALPVQDNSVEICGTRFNFLE
jgi:hypothetical protein